MSAAQWKLYKQIENELSVRCARVRKLREGQGLVLLPTENWTVPSPHRAHGWERRETSAGSRGARYLGAGRLGVLELTWGSSEAQGRVLADSECVGRYGEAWGC